MGGLEIFAAEPCPLSASQMTPKPEPAPPECALWSESEKRDRPNTNPLLLLEHGRKANDLQGPSRAPSGKVKLVQNSESMLV